MAPHTSRLAVSHARDLRNVPAQNVVPAGLGSVRERGYAAGETMNEDQSVLPVEKIVQHTPLNLKSQIVTPSWGGLR